MKTDFRALVEAAKQGDSAAYTELYQRTVEQMLGRARSMVRNEQDAMDLLQESYLYAFRSLGQLEHPEYFSTWLYRIVTNRCKNFLTRSKPNLFEQSMTDEEGVEFDREDEDITFRPDESLDYSETKRLVREIVDALPDDQRSCVLLHYFQELKVGEIARLLDVPENTVKSRLNYARKKIMAGVQALEKQGTKLYAVPFFPFLRWAFQQGTHSMAQEAGAGLLGRILGGLGASDASPDGSVPTLPGEAAGAAAASAAGTGASAAVGTAAASAAAGGAAAAGGLLSALGVKVMAIVAATVVAVSGVAAVTHVIRGGTVSPPEESGYTGPHDPALAQAAYAAYDAFLQDYQEDAPVPANYFYVRDLDYNDVPELLVADGEGEGSKIELYTFQGGEMQQLYRSEAPSTGPLSLANGRYVTLHTDGTLHYLTAEDAKLYELAVTGEGLSENGRAKRLDAQELAFYQAEQPGEGFVQQLEPLELTRNDWAVGLEWVLQPQIEAQQVVPLDQDALLVERDGRWGIEDYDGQVLLPPEYDGWGYCGRRIYLSQGDTWYFLGEGHAVDGSAPASVIGRDLFVEWQSSLETVMSLWENGCYQAELAGVGRSQYGWDEENQTFFTEGGLGSSRTVSGPGTGAVPPRETTVARLGWLEALDGRSVWEQRDPRQPFNYNAQWDPDADSLLLMGTDGRPLTGETYEAVAQFQPGAAYTVARSGEDWMLLDRQGGTDGQTYQEADAGMGYLMVERDDEAQLLGLDGQLLLDGMERIRLGAYSKGPTAFWGAARMYEYSLEQNQVVWDSEPAELSGEEERIAIRTDGLWGVANPHSLKGAGDPQPAQTAAADRSQYELPDAPEDASQEEVPASRLVRRNGFDVEGNLIWYHLLTYDQEGRLIQTALYDPAGNQLQTFEHRYDGQGNDLNSCSWRSDTGEMNEATISYDEAGVRTGISYSGGDRESYFHDDQGRTSKVEVYNGEDGSLRQIISYEYNDRGQRTRITVYQEDGSLYETTEYEYNAQGDETRSTAYRQDGTVKRYTVTEYDGNGNKVKSVRYDSDGTEVVRDEYEYNQDGVLVREAGYLWEPELYRSYLNVEELYEPVPQAD